MEDKKRPKISSQTSRKKLRTVDDTEDLGYETQIASCSFQTPSQNDLSHETEVGIIERVSLVNFMCHAKLDFEFGPNVTVIVGRNGSGKSAILTALVVGLGGRASDTSRGSNLKNFIKNGESYAVVEIQLRNRGPDAFKPEEYGNHIIVIRRLAVEGSNAYKLKSSKGKIISTKKEDLLTILEHFNIQVDNPVSVMTQNVSRSFLNTKSSKDKYKFFMKATQLDQIKKSNTAAVEELRVAEDRLNREQESLPLLQRDVEEWRTRMKLVHRMEEHRSRVIELQGELSWSYIIQKEKDANKAKSDFDNHEVQVQEIADNMKSITEFVQDKTLKHTELNNDLQNYLDQIKSLKQNRAEVSKQIQDVKVERRTKEYEKRTAESKLRSTVTEQNTLKVQIEQIIKSEPQGDDSEKQRRNQQINKLQEELNQLEATIKARKQHLNVITGSISHYNEEISQCRMECQSIERKLDYLKRKKLELEGSRQNSLQRFGPYMPALLNRIEQEWKKNSFRQKPLGPIAHLIGLREAKWALAIEACLGPLLEAFCCDNHQDQMVLKNIINAIGMTDKKPTIIVSEFQNRIYDVSNNIVVCPPHCSILDMLNISNPVIANALIDMRGIESILLIENKTEARRIMTYSVPQNCKQCFTIEGDQIFGFPAFRNYSNYRKFAKYLQCSIDEEIKEKQEEHSKLTVSLQEKHKLLSEKEVTIKQNRIESVKTEEEMTKVSRSHAQLKSNLDTLMNFVEPEPVDVSSLEQEMKLALEKQITLEGVIKGFEEEIKGNRDKQQTLEIKYKEVDEEMLKWLTMSQSLRDQIESLNVDIHDKKKEKQLLGPRLTEKKEAAKALEQNWKKLQTQAEDMVTKTSELFPDRVETERSSNMIHSEIKKINENLRLEEERRSSAADVSQGYTHAKARLHRTVTDITDCVEMMKQIRIGVKSRQARFVSLRNSQVIRINQVFMVYLNSRHFRGSIKFDHKDGTLLFEIQSNENVQEMCKDLGSLSGGERSFATVCFITSLWETMESPFRVLDEYDVFMDMVNRRLSMDILVHVAKNKSSKQFIFLTPMELAKMDSDVRICRMPDPERGLMEEDDDD